jgi:chromosome segregation ATPase
MNMKRTMLWSAILSTSLVFGMGCKKKEADTESAAEKVQEAKEDIKDETKDVVEERKDVMEEQKDVNAAKQDLAQARAEFETAVNTRIAALDAKITELEKRGDEKSRQLAADFRTRRDQAKTKLATIGEKTSDTWDAFKADVSSGWDQLEKDVNDALK